MKMYEFVGGRMNGVTLTETGAKAFFETSGNGLNEDLSDIRNRGGLVHREELDNEYQFKGYLGPMFDGFRYIVNGEPKYEWLCSEEEKQTCESLYVLRYETPEVYDQLSR